MKHSVFQIEIFGKAANMIVVRVRKANDVKIAFLGFIQRVRQVNAFIIRIIFAKHMRIIDQDTLIIFKFDKGGVGVANRIKSKFMSRNSLIKLRAVLLKERRLPYTLNYPIA
jgi:hypothetical protein